MINFKIIVLILFLVLIRINIYSQYWQGYNNLLPLSSIVSSCYDTINHYMYAVGNLTYNNHLDENHAYWYNQNKWDTLPAIFNNITTTTVMYNNELFIGGLFSTVNGDTSIGLVKWVGNSFILFGKRITREDSYTPIVTLLKVINNKLLIGGSFTLVDSLPAYNLAWFDGNNFTPLPIGPYSIFTPTDAIWYNNMLIIVGNIDNSGTSYNIIAFKDNQWIDFPSGSVLGSDNGVECIELYNNELYIGGYFRKIEGNAGNYIQSTNGTAWKEVGGGTSFILSNPNSNGQIHSLNTHKGKLYAGGIFNYAGGINAQRIAVWDNNKWCRLGSTFDNMSWGRIYSIEFYKDTLFIFGDFTVIDGVQTNGIAKWIGGDYVDTCSQPYSVPEISDNTGVAIFPNPVHSHIKITSNNGEPIKHAEIYSLTGKMVLRKELNPVNAEIDVSGLEDGLYFVKVKTLNNLLIRKIVIMN